MEDKKMKAQIASGLDWITATKVGSQYGEEILPLDGIKMGRRITPTRNFTTAYELEPAGLFQATSGKEGVAMLQLTGKDLIAWRKIGWSDMRIMSHINVNRMKFTRMDFAVDIFGIEHALQQVHNRYNQGYVMTRARSVTEYMGDNGGRTIYFGSRKSDKFVRVYDKAKEQNLLSEAWARVELQTRKEQSNILANAMYAATIQDAGKARIADVIKIPSLTWWTDAMQHDTVEFASRAETSMPRREWLDKQVSPTFAKDDWT